MGSYIIELYSEVTKVKKPYYWLRIYNTIFIIINKFIKQGYFIIYTKEILVKDIAQIYIKKIFIKYKVLVKIILDKDTKFIIIF